MIPGMNPRQMKQAMKQMGIQQVDIEAHRVVIECPDRRIVIENPQVAKVNMMGQDTWQVIGPAREEALDTTPDITEEDVKTVVVQTGVSEEVAKSAIKEAGGDLAQAILELQDD